jgi:hypothetical protein
MRPQGLRLWAVLAVVVLAAVVMFNLPLSPPHSALPPSDAGLQTFGKPFTPSGALHIPLSGPVLNLVQGDRVNVTYEYEAVTYNSSFSGMTLRFPTVDGVFTQPGGGLVFIPVLDREATLSHAGFSNGSTTKVSEVMTGNFTLNPNVQPFLTTLKLAIMANATYGTLQLAIRWDYSIWVKANDTTFSSGWSRFGNGGGQESSVIPAALVTIVRQTPEYTTVGSRFTAELTGMVSGASYWVEVENPFTGISISKLWDNASVGVTTYNVSILLQGGRGSMAAGPWLVHIHDSYKQILYSLPVYLTDPTVATLFFRASPSSCGPIDFNGSSQASGSVRTHLAANQTYSLSVGASSSGCTFTGWSQSGGGAQIANTGQSSTTLLLRYNDTIVANFS